MWEIISSFFGMIWALVGVILQLALPCIFIYFVILIIGKVAGPLIKRGSMLMFGIDPKSYKEEFNRAKYGTAHSTRAEKKRVNRK